LEGTLARLDTSNKLLLETDGKISITNAQLRSTNTTLQKMEGNIEAMTRKITHAKLLF
jgi:hypothetical protein